MRNIVASLLLLSSVTAVKAEWYHQMQIGPAWSNTFGAYINGEKGTGAIKGILVDMGDDNRALFDTENLRVVAAYKGNVDWAGTPWTGAHGTMITIQNGGSNGIFSTVGGPGWADASGNLADKRAMPGYGNLDYAKFKGYFRDGKKIIFAYEVLGTPVYESFEATADGFVRQFQVAPHKAALTLVVADDKSDFEVRGGLTAKSKSGMSVAVSPKSAMLAEGKGRLLAKLPAAAGPLTFTITYNKSGDAKPAEPVDLAARTKGGDPFWKEPVVLAGNVSTDKTAPWVVDTLTVPVDNPYKSNIRFSGFDFVDEDTAAICTWNGDVWTVSGLKGDWSKITWRRFASGLFEPLGLKVVNGTIYVHGRDQITKLTDLNKDGEADRFESFFREYTVSKNFHEFDFELQTDKAGNFYTAKASPVRAGGRGFDQIFPHHGTLMRISPDGSKYQIIATGLRAPGGLAVGPNGEVTTSENEGTWQPCCKINYFMPGNTPVFLGTEDSRHEVKGAMTEPLCYLPMAVDNSGGSQVWIPEGVKWGIKPGELLQLSYGQSSIYHVLRDPVDGTMQGGVVKLPIKLQSSAMRARFHKDGSMYVCGLRGWQTNAASETAFQRIRYNEGAPVVQPNQLEFTRTGVRLHFDVALDPELAKDPHSFSAERWNYVRGPQYGGGEYSVDKPDKAAEKNALEKEDQGHKVRDKIAIKAARVSSDGKTVDLDLEGHKPSMQIQVNWQLEDTKGQAIEASYWGTYRKPGK